MKPKDIRLLPKEPLSPADKQVLRARFNKRLRGFFALAGMLIVLVDIELGPNTQKINDAIRDPKLRWVILGASFVLGSTMFYRRVWIYRRDLNAGFRYVNSMLVIGKNPPHADGSHSIDLEDLDYHRLQVDAATWARLQPGDRYGIAFAAHSHYPLSRDAAAITPGFSHR